MDIFLLMMEQPNPGITIRLDYPQRAVGAAVVADYQLILRAQLAQDGVNLFSQEALAVVGGHADGNHVLHLKNRLFWQNALKCICESHTSCIKINIVGVV